jgi:hypothetical protein
LTAALLLLDPKESLELAKKEIATKLTETVNMQGSHSSVSKGSSGWVLLNFLCSKSAKISSAFCTTAIIINFFARNVTEE